jgi:phenylacetate-CoA ligase
VSAKQVSEVVDVGWPAIPNPKDAILSSVVKDLELNQHRSAGELVELRERQVAALLRHAHATCPLYAERLAAAGYRSGDTAGAASWVKIKPLRRQDIQQHSDSLKSTAVLPTHGKTFEEATSGSSGTPVTVLRTGLTALVSDAFTIFEHRFHRRDFAGKHAFLKFFDDPKFAKSADGVRQPTWGPPVNRLFESGPSIAMSVEAPITQQAEFLLREAPQYILTYPSNLAALALHFRSRNTLPKGLRQLRTLGETLSPEVRELCHEVFGLPIDDMYSCCELGYMALQCPDGQHYHEASENAFVEILDDDNKPVATGETGRVVVTSLMNFAMPLIRYDIGDRAVRGESGACGRPQSVIETVLGRSRDMLRLPSGESVWPRLCLHHLGPKSGAAIEQAQIVQESLDRIRVRLVAASALAPAQEQIIREILQESLQHPFDIAFEVLPEIPKGARGKFHDFLCEIS